MSGATVRNKGREGERRAKALLKDNDWTIVADTTAGLSTGDLIVSDPNGKVYDVEVKNRRMINVPLFLGQARKNAARSKQAWMVMCRIDGSGSWLIFRKGERIAVWHEK